MLKKDKLDVLEQLMAAADLVQPVTDAELELTSGASAGMQTCVMSGNICCTKGCPPGRGPQFPGLDRLFPPMGPMGPRFPGLRRGF